MTLLLNALHGRNPSRPPVWLMRQAGRFLPEYRALRQKHSFLEMCHTPEIAAQVTRLPIDLLGVDAAILFSDILVIPEALGVGLRFEDAIGPIIERPLQQASDVDALPRVDVSEKLQFVGSTIKALKKDLKVPLLGFCGAPYTVAAYMIEGKTSRDWKKTKKWMLQDPQSFHSLLNKITDATIDYLKLQIEAGVDAVQIFDSWANSLGPTQFRDFSLAYLDKIVKAVRAEGVPVILFCKGSSVFAPQLARIQPSAISLDWNADIATARQAIPREICVQGNLDPDILYAPAAVIRQEAKRILDAMKDDQAFIFNLGHGVNPDTPVDAVKTLIATVHAS